MHRLSTRTLKTLVQLLGVTWRVHVRGEEHLACLRASNRPFIFALWHGDLLPLLWFHRGQGTSLVVSKHRDGDRLARAATGWGYHIIPGSSSRGGSHALRQMVRTLSTGREVAVTPDGPRGPARLPKAGIVAAAQQAGAPVLPVAATARPAVRLASWDGFLIPGPFARVQIVYGPPLEFAPGKGARAAGLDALQSVLDEASNLAAC